MNLMLTQEISFSLSSNAMQITTLNGVMARKILFDFLKAAWFHLFALTQMP